MLLFNPKKIKNESEKALIKGDLNTYNRLRRGRRYIVIDGLPVIGLPIYIKRKVEKR